MTIRVWAVFCVLVSMAGAAGAKAPLEAAPLVRAFLADAVVIGKVESFEAAMVEVKDRPDSRPDAYRVAVVKVSGSLLGAKGLTHVKVGLPIHIDFELKESFEGCLYLRKHSTADFYTFDYMTTPLKATDERYVREVSVAAKMLRAAADPVAALRAEQAEDRYLAAAYLLTRYSKRPEGNVKEVPVPAEEKALLFDALLGVDWERKPDDPIPGIVAPTSIVSHLSRGRAGAFTPKPFTGTGDYNAHMKAEFQKWVAGDGANYELKKFVPKLKNKK
jgi:hypothetical protein